MRWGRNRPATGRAFRFRFEVRRGWETGDSVSSWGVHGGAIQVGLTIYKPDVAESFGDGRRWQRIADPDSALAAKPLACAIYAAVAGGFVVFSTDPDMAGEYVTPIAILDGVRLVQLVVGNIRMAGAHATSHLYGAGSSSAGALNFTSEQNSNSAIVEAAHAADTITIKRTAWYTVSIGARFRVSLGAAAYRGHSQVVVQLDTGAGPVDTVLLIEFCVQHLATAPIGSPTPLAFVTVSRQLDIQLSKDDVITATAPYNDYAEYANCRLTVRHIHD
jgi:hypothetical protein